MSRPGKQIFTIFCLPFLLLLFSCAEKSKNILIYKTLCNYHTSPTGITNPVTFGWKLKSQVHNQYQTAYQIIVSDNLKDLKKNIGNIWSSEIVKSDISVGISAENLNLLPGKRYFWKVKVWDKNNKESEWSEPSQFITGLNKPDDWGNAKWISMEEMHDSLILVPGIPTWRTNTENVAVRRPIVPLFRNEFSVNKKIKSAFLFISGLGHYRANINGIPVSDGFLSPGWTHYQKTCLYNTYDITSNIQKGQNSIGVIVGPGFYNINNERYRKLLITYGMPKLIAKIAITYSDGSTEFFNTDEDWKVARSPITYSSIYGGENYDARLEQEGWDLPGFDDSQWQNALLAKHPGGQLIAETNYPLIVKETFAPQEVAQIGKDSLMIDFGQNASGIFEIKVKGNKGDTIKIIPSELINEDKTAFQRFTGSPYYFIYVLKGDGIETWRPKFSYYGFRYLQVYGACTPINNNKQAPELLEIKMLHTSNSAPKAGSFSCSNKLFNNIDTLIRYAIQSNIQSVFTDCPHREKLGWTEQTYLLGKSMQFNFDLYHQFCKLVHDMIDSQKESGLIGSIAPEYIVFSDHIENGEAFTDSPEWGSAIVQVPWLVYNLYGDITLMQKAWDSMLEYMNYLDSKANNHILSYGLGDWYDLGPEPPGFSQLSPIATTATGIYYYDYIVLSKMAKKLYKKAEAKEFLKKAELIREAYNNLLFNEDSAIYGHGSQSSMAIPLSMGIVKDKYREKVLQNLVDSILLNNKILTAGDIGFHYLIDALTKGNQTQLIYDMNNRDDVPGYGYQIRKGATAMTESWEALREKSNNHMMLGHIEEWFYNGLGGIRQDDNSVAFKNIVINPAFVQGLYEVKTSFESPYGLIRSEWIKDKQKTIMLIEIPVNTKARVYIPSGDTTKITVNKQKLSNNPEIEIFDHTKEITVVKIGSGKYNISVSL
jgi:hypothetical protein